MNKKNNQELILSGSIIKAIITLTIPVVINSFLQTMYNLTDTYWMGKLGTNELAAVNLVSPVYSIVVSFGSGLTIAGSVLVAQYIGAKQIKEANSMANQIFACAMIFAVVCAGITCIFTPNIVNWLGADGEIHKYATMYMQWMILAVPFLFAVNIYSALHQAQGDTVKPMLFNSLGLSLNMVLAPLLMFGLGWGVLGAAVAGLVAKSIPAIITFIALHGKKQDIRLQLMRLKFEKEKIKKIITIGLPTAIGGSTMQLGFLLMSKNVFSYGSQAMAAYGIGNKVNGLITLPSNGIGSAVATVVGQNIGAEQYDRAEESYKISRRISVIFLFVGGFILSRMPISTAIVGVFSKDATVVALAADFLSILALYCWTNGIYNTTSGLFQGSAHTEVVMAVDMIRLWIFRFATLYICQKFLNMGVRSVWYSVVVSNGLSAVLLWIAYRRKIWKKKRI